MKDALGEVLVVLSNSGRTQLCIFLALAFFFWILLTGDYLMSDFAFKGFLAPYSDWAREKFLRRYDKLAFGALITFLWLAFKCYRRDRKRLFESW